MDYYKILGIRKNSTQADIKNAYKKLAIKYHPDKNDNDKYAADKFKEISKAYHVLIDQDKRKIYDITGQDDISTTDIDIDFSDIFANFFENIKSNLNDIKIEIFNMDPIINDFNNINNMNDIKKTDDIYYNIHANLEDIYDKKTKNITLKHLRKFGSRITELDIEYNIPLFMKETIFYQEAHDKLGDNYKRGDVIFTIIDKSHNIFKRINDYDLIMDRDINLYDIYHGFTFNFIHLNKENITVICNSENFFQQNHLHHKLSELGLPNDLGNRGDLFIKYNLILSPHVNLKYIDKISPHHYFDNHNSNNDNKDKDANNNHRAINAEKCSYLDVYKNYE